MKIDPNKHRPAWRSRGFTLMEVMIGVVIVGIVGAGGTALYTRYKQDQVEEARGKQIGVGLGYLDRYARKFQSQLTSGQSISGVANPYAPTLTELAGLGVAPASFSDVDQLGGPLKYLLSREPAGCAAAKCVLSMTVVTSGSVQPKGSPDLEMAQKIAGYVPNGAGWSNLPNDPTKLGKIGKTIPNPLGSTPAVVAGAMWLGSSQASATVPPVSYNYRSKSCGSGYTGSKEQSQSVTTDKWGTVTLGGWVTYSDSCEAIPPPPPPPVTTTPSSGGTESGGTTPSGGGTTPDGGGTTPVTTTPTNNDTTPQTGTCANNATDYPTCTPPYTPPPVKSEPTLTGCEHVTEKTITANCVPGRGSSQEKFRLDYWTVCTYSDGSVTKTSSGQDWGQSACSGGGGTIIR